MSRPRSVHHASWFRVHQFNTGRLTGTAIINLHTGTVRGIATAKTTMEMVIATDTSLALTPEVSGQ